MDQLQPGQRIDLQTFLKMTEGYPRWGCGKDLPRLDSLEEFLTWRKQLSSEEQPRSFTKDYLDALMEARTQGKSAREADMEASEKANAFAQPGRERRARLFKEYMRSITPYKSLSPLLQKIVRELYVLVDESRVLDPEDLCSELIALQEYIGARRLIKETMAGHAAAEVPTLEELPLEELQLVDAYLREWKAHALGLPPVQRVLTILQRGAENTSYSLQVRKDASEVLKHLLNHLIPPVPKSPWLDLTWDAQVRRCGLLLEYEHEYAKIKGIMIQKFNGRAARLRALKEAYPDIDEKDLQCWNPRKLEPIALDLVAKRRATTAETLRKILHQARKERDQASKERDRQ
jgi:hypothetical protein